IVVGTPTWSQDLAAAAADPLPDANVMYALHFYAATHEDDLRRALSTAVAGGLPVFVTEFGICEASGAGEIDYASANLWVRLMNELDVSYICWNLSNKDETAALFKPGCAKTSGFTLDDLTDEGLWLVDTLKSPGFSREEVALARAEVKDNSAGAQMLVSADDTLQWTFQVADRWEEGGRTFFRYEMAGSNYSAGVKSWSVVVPFNGEVTLEDAWNCKASASGTRLTVANDAHNGNVPAGGFVRDVGFIVSGPADLAVVEYE
ncbi:cellulase family glycosylhydrolase, partial [Adlercreutzia sp.]